MRMAAVGLFATVACGGVPGPGFYEASPGRPDLSTEIGDVGRLCDEGSDCAAGLACTNLIDAAHPECELPWSRDERCPAGTSKMMTATAAPGSTVDVGDLAYTGSFCTVDCASDADCHHGQRCAGAGAAPGYCTR